MQCFTVTWSVVLLALALVCSLRVSSASSAKRAASDSVQCTSNSTRCNNATTLGSCTYRDCTDPVNNVSVSFSACQKQEGSDATSVYTYTNVTCPCNSGSGDVDVLVELPDGSPLNYRNLDKTPDPALLNATQCDNGMQVSKPYSFCIKFASLTMVEDITGTKLMSEVTVNVTLADSSKACSVIRFSASLPTTPTSPPTSASSGLSTTKTVTLLLPLLGSFILVKLLDRSQFFST